METKENEAKKAAKNNHGARAAVKWKKLLLKNQLKFIEPIEGKRNYVNINFFFQRIHG